MAAVTTALLVAGCGSNEGLNPIAKRGLAVEDGSPAYPLLATSNTTRIAGRDPVEDAAFAALAAFPGGQRSARPNAVALIDRRNWQAAVAAAVLSAQPIRTPILLSEGDELPEVTKSAIATLQPVGLALGHRRSRRTRAVSIATQARPGGLRTRALAARGPAAQAAAIDRFAEKFRARPKKTVLLVSAQASSFALPAAAWAAKSGTPVLFLRRRSIPKATKRALLRHGKPRVFVLGPPKVISGKVVRSLRRLARQVTRIDGPNPTSNSIAFARYHTVDFGWGVVDPGHGLVFVNAKRPVDVAAAAPLASTGTYGPLLVTASANRLAKALRSYLLDIQPGYRFDPVRGLYNHAWLIGNEDAFGLKVQAEIDQLVAVKKIGPKPKPDTKPSARARRR